MKFVVKKTYDHKRRKKNMYKANLMAHLPVKSSSNVYSAWRKVEKMARESHFPPHPLLSYPLYLVGRSVLRREKHKQIEVLKVLLVSL